MAHQSPRVRPIRRRRRSEIQLVNPGIPGAENRWYPSRGQARKSALRYASMLGAGCRVHWHAAHAPGQLSHYHVLCPTLHISGHFYHGPRVARKAPPNARPPRRRTRGERELGSIVDTVAGALSPKLPPDLTRTLFMLARMYFAVYGPITWRRLVESARHRLQGSPSLTPQQAIFQSARALGVPVRHGTGASGPITQERVRQMRLRQMQRLPSKRRKLAYRRQRY